MYVAAYETSSKTGNFLLDHALSMDNVCNRCLFSIPSKHELNARRGKKDQAKPAEQALVKGCGVMCDEYYN